MTVPWISTLNGGPLPSQRNIMVCFAPAHCKRGVRFFPQHPPTDNRAPTQFEFLSCFVIFHSNFIPPRFELKLSQLCPIVALVNQNHTPSPSHNGRGNQEPCAQSLGESRKPVEPCSIVIFGASGDLTSRKLIPALYHLVKE